MNILFKIASYLLLVLLVRFNASAQKDPLHFDYSKVDNYVSTVKVKKSTDIPELAKLLTGKFTTDVEKARAIFKWVAENISYDTKQFHSGSKGYSFTYTTEEEKNRLLKEKDIKMAGETLNKKAGVCQGYSTLIKTLCDEAGLEIKIISGYARIDQGRIGEVYKESPNHAWNTIKLNNKWYLWDATWASGYTDPGVTKFTKEYSDKYFLTPPDLFILDHFPEDENWQLLDAKITKKEFFNYPLIYRGFHSKNITGFSPKTGVLEVKKGGAVKFGITSDGPVSSISVFNQSDKFGEDVKVEKKGKQYSFTYFFQKKGTHIFNVFVDHQQALVYKVIVK